MLILLAPFASAASSQAPGITSRPWGYTPDDQAVELYTLRNAAGMEVAISNYGGTIVSLVVPDQSGRMADIVLGFDSIDGYTSPLYLKEGPYFGALIGRYANRIAHGRFRLDGKSYALAINNGPNHLHGGVGGFDKAVWTPSPIAEDTPRLELRYRSKDGEEGYPGNLDVTVVYSLTGNNELKIDYIASADRDTIANITNHSYFNLKGAGEGDILGHRLQVIADRFTPVDATLIPTGELRPVKGTPFDFTVPVAIGARIAANDEQLHFGNGYDHNFVLNGESGSLRMAARVEEPTSGRTMEVWTTEPGVQVYTGNFLKGDLISKGGKPYEFRSGLVLETQHFPDSPNHPEFPTATIKAGQTYRSETIFRFGVDR